ncbi:MAG: short-chain dehydrogenase [Nocardioidaceae bacterium]|nr:short-chain dehydrogenase [Nocardioidaceae bacterium]
MLEGKSIVITGSGRGLGRAAAISAATEYGAHVVVNDVDLEQAEAVVAEIREAGGVAVASGHSVADAEQARALIELCVTEFGRIDGLVNNAGLTLLGDPSEVLASNVDRLVDVNVKGVLFCGIAALAHMKAQRSGIIVNVTSRTHVGYYDAALYAATKGATASATYSWALDMAPYGVRVTGFAPSAQTRMSGSLENLSDPSDVTNAVIYLLSDRAAKLSGQILRFNGDSLNLMKLPEFEPDNGTYPHLSVTGIADLIDNELSDQISGVGLTMVDLTTLG